MDLGHIELTSRLQMFEKVLDRDLANRDGLWEQLIQQFDLTLMSRPPAATSTLLSTLISRNFTVIDVIRSLEFLGLHEAASYLAEPEELQIHGLDIIEGSPDQDDSLHVRIGSRLHLKMNATGIPMPSFLWFHNNIPYSSGPELLIDFVREEHEGQYCCIAKQVQGFNLIKKSSSEDVTVKLLKGPKILRVEPSSKTLELKIGQNLEVSVFVSQHSPVTFSWWHDFTELKDQKNNTLRLEKISSNHEGNYECRIVNEDGIACHAFNIYVSESRPCPTEKKALIIANSNYPGFWLNSPQNDANELQRILDKYGFECTVLHDITGRDMHSKMKSFCDTLKVGSYVLFCFAGHGFYSSGSCLMGTDAHMPKPKPEHILHELEALDMFLSCKPLMCTLVFDICQTQIASDVLVPVKMKQRRNGNVFLCYATSVNRKALEPLDVKPYSVFMRHFLHVLDNQREWTFLNQILEVNKRVRRSSVQQDPVVSVPARTDYRLSDPIDKSADYSRPMSQ